MRCRYFTRRSYSFCDSRTKPPPPVIDFNRRNGYRLQLLAVRRMSNANGFQTRVLRVSRVKPRKSTPPAIYNRCTVKAAAGWPSGARGRSLESSNYYYQHRENAFKSYYRTLVFTKQLSFQSFIEYRSRNIIILA